MGSRTSLLISTQCLFMSSLQKHDEQLPQLELCVSRDFRPWHLPPIGGKADGFSPVRPLQSKSKAPAFPSLPQKGPSIIPFREYKFWKQVLRAYLLIWALKPQLPGAREPRTVYMLGLSSLPYYCESFLIQWRKKEQKNPEINVMMSPSNGN